MLVSIGIAILNLKNHNVAGNGRRRKFSIMDRIPAQIQNLSDLVEVSDEDCKNKLRMDRNSFYRLCDLLQNNGGLKLSKYISVYEKVAMFFSILAHHSKNRCVKFQFKRTISFIDLFSFCVVSNPSMDPVAARVGHNVDKVKASRGRRSWSRVEEDALIHCLTDIINNGWKAENGFKARFQRELEKGMRRILLGTDIIANPYINSKIHVWKKEYSALSDLLSKSGIGWNSTTSMIEVEDEGVWYASKWYLKGIKSGSKGTKRKNRDPEVNALVETLGEFMKQSNSTFGDIGKGIGPSTEPQIDNNKLNEIMNRIVGLKRADKLKVCDKLLRNKSPLDFFMFLPTEDQEEYAWMLLDGRL
ncbi:hypothetical protein ACS0TY_002299 [Phlomoides rotata]